ncbi:MAG: UDP-N-acetylmuramoyl-L-alanine--D-glutamate ligase [Ignavibacteriae bacterium]|nr:UDP-N-acetylmuramoyl-L-alanine--D-glutamate ligase [Ignavibacteriota bacterium]
MDILNKKISILGAVRSGISAAKLAQKKGAIPFVSDMSDNSEIRKNISVLDELNIEYELGQHSEKIFDCDFIVTSPGVPSNSKVIVEANLRGIKIVSEIEFAYWFCKAKIIAITGTNGKTTTTSLCEHVLNNSGLKAYAAGNIGLPFSEIVDDLGKNDFVVLEVSSFQLDFIDLFTPDFAIMLNITPDHLDRYENRFDLYIKSKMRIIKNQNEQHTFIYNGDDENIPVGYVSSKVNLSAFSIEKNISNGCFLDDDWIVYAQDDYEEDICQVEDLLLKGDHNLMNSMAVINVAMKIGIDKELIKTSLGTFKGVEHRLEFVKEINGIKFINDSKATNVDSVWYALRSFEEPIYLILGGKDKGNNYNDIKEEVKKRVKKIYAIGSSSQKVFDFFKNIKPVEIVDSLNTAVKNGLSEASDGDIVLLSPACASFDMFKNYEDRGFQFKSIVNSIE